MDEEDNPRKSYPRDRNCYKILCQVSEEFRTLVFKAICIPFNSVVAIKIIDTDEPGNQLDVNKIEARNNGLPQHPNILKSHCCFVTDVAQLWVVMPYISGGSLQSILPYSFPCGLPVNCIPAVLSGVLRALVCIHSRGFTHRGIKAGNILMDCIGNVALSDFGVSSLHYEKETLFDDAIGSSSPYWVAPEVIVSELGFRLESDIWSFGVTALELFCVRPPIFQLPESKCVILKMLKRFRCFNLRNNRNGNGDINIPDSFKEIIGSCLELDPKKRPTAKELLYHPIFKNCMGPGYLFKNVFLEGALPNVKERFMDPKTQKSIFLSKNNESVTNSFPLDKTGMGRKLLGWIFDRESFLLQAVHGAIDVPNVENLTEDIGKETSLQALLGLMSIGNIRFGADFTEYAAIAAFLMEEDEQD